MNELEEALWNAMLDSEMNALYYGYISRRYEKREKLFQIFVVVLATSSIGSLQLWKMETSWFKWIWIFDILSVLAVIVTVSLPFVNFNNIANKACGLRSTFQMFTNKYESLWIQRKAFDLDKLHNQFTAIKNEEIQQTSGDSTMPRDLKLLEKCQDEIINSKNLS